MGHIAKSPELPKDSNTSQSEVTLRYLLRELEETFKPTQVHKRGSLKDDFQRLVDFLDAQLGGFNICTKPEVCNFAGECGDHYVYTGCPAYRLLRLIIARDRRGTISP